MAKRKEPAVGREADGTRDVPLSDPADGTSNPFAGVLSMVDYDIFRDDKKAAKNNLGVSKAQSPRSWRV